MLDRLKSHCSKKEGSLLTWDAMADIKGTWIYVDMESMLMLNNRSVDILPNSAIVTKSLVSFIWEKKNEAIPSV